MTRSAVKRFIPFLSLLCLAAAPVTRAQTFCIFDPMGTQGEIFATAKDYQFAARTWGVTLELKAYTDERVAAEDFKAGQCDGVAITGLRARQFVPFTGSLDAIGAVPDYTLMRKAMDLLTTPKLGPLMVNGAYETAAVIPIGAAYPFVNDRSINTLDKAAGKKIAVMEWDKSQAQMVQLIGAQPVASDISNFAGKFNNGQVDIVVAPIIAYRPLELYRGLGSKGAIARFPVIQLTGQVIIRHERFPPGFGQKAREYAMANINRAFGMIRNEERGVDSAHWMHVPLSDRSGYTRLMREARIHLTKAGFYDKRMMTILKRVRCKADPDEAECSLTDE